MSVFADLLDLQTAVVELVGDNRVVEVMPRLVKMSEIAFNRRLRCRDQITSMTVTIASGSVAVPDGFLEAIGLYDANGYEYVQQPTQNSRISTVHRNFYAINGSNIITAGADGDRTLEYYAEIPTISAALDDTSWLLAKHPSLYLYGVGFEAAKHLRDAGLASEIKGLLEMEFRDIEAQDARERYSRARVRVAGVTP